MTTKPKTRKAHWHVGQEVEVQEYDYYSMTWLWCAAKIEDITDDANVFCIVFPDGGRCVRHTDDIRNVA